MLQALYGFWLKHAGQRLWQAAMLNRTTPEHYGDQKKASLCVTSGLLPACQQKTAQHVGWTWLPTTKLINAGITHQRWVQVPWQGNSCGQATAKAAAVAASNLVGRDDCYCRPSPIWPKPGTNNED